MARALEWGRLLALAALLACAQGAGADASGTIARVKLSVMALGTFERTRSPQFEFLGTAFVVGDGSHVITNYHVLPAKLDADRRESVVVVMPFVHEGRIQFRELKRVEVDEASDLALLSLDGPPMQPLRLRDSDTVREGQEILMTGFPIGAILGPYAATHRGMISAVTPIAIPQSRAGDLDARTLHRLAAGSFPVFQLDATAYPGNSGSPVYDPQSGEVLGIVNMVFVKGTKESILKEPSGIVYAIPAKHAQKLLDRIR